MLLECCEHKVYKITHVLVCVSVHLQRPSVQLKYSIIPTYKHENDRECVWPNTRVYHCLLSSSNFTRSKLLTFDLKADLIDLMWGM